jgi:ribosome-binding protein aMBF1 (putative translation factor)
MNDKKLAFMNKFYNKTNDPFVFSANREKNKSEISSDCKITKEYLHLTKDNKNILKDSYFIVFQILDGLDKKGISKHQFATSLNVNIEEVNIYFSGEHDFNQELKDKIQSLLNIKLI